MTNKYNLSTIYNSTPQTWREAKENDQIIALMQQWHEEKISIAKEIITTTYIPLTIKIANKFSQKYKLDNDLKEELEGRLLEGLSKAIEKYNYKKPKAIFHTYASASLRGEALDFIRFDYLNLNLGRESYLFYNMGKLEKEITKEAPEISEHDLIQQVINMTGSKHAGTITLDDYKRIKQLRSQVSNGQMSTEKELAAANIDDTNHSSRPEARHIDLEEQSFKDKFVNVASQHLDPITRYILEKSVMQDEPVSKKEIAQKLGYSETYIEELFNGGIEKLQKLLGNNNEEQGAITPLTEKALAQKFPNAKAIPEDERTETKIEYHGYKTNIIIAAINHFNKEGKWPTTASGTIETGELKGKKWRIINEDLNKGRVDNCRAKKLIDFLAPYKKQKKPSVKAVTAKAKSLYDSNFTI